MSIESDMLEAAVGAKGGVLLAAGESTENRDWMIVKVLAEGTLTTTAKEGTYGPALSGQDVQQSDVIHGRWSIVTAGTSTLIVYPTPRRFLGIANK